VQDFSAVEYFYYFFSFFHLTLIVGKIGNKKSFGVQEKWFGVQGEASTRVKSWLSETYFPKICCLFGVTRLRSLVFFKEAFIE